MSVAVKNQSGFTLVEIAIVLVIISLLLGGVLKGTELIENSKVRRSVNDVNGVAAAYNAYIDRYRAIPGDDGNSDAANLQARGSSWSTVNVAGDSDGRLLANRANAFDGGGETAAFWQHLRAAGFISGDPSLAGANSVPRNAFGGSIGVVTQIVNSTLPGFKVCLSQVPGKAAYALDNQMDDGAGGTGSMRATPGNVNGQNTVPSNTALNAAYNEDLTYTLCMRI